MSLILRTCLLAAAAVPAFALAMEELDGAWKVNVEATWTELLKDPEYAAMPKGQQDQMKPMVCGSLARTSLAIKGGVSTATNPDGSTTDAGTLTGWISTGPTSATATSTDKQGKTSEALIEKPDARSLRMTITKYGRKMTMVLTARPAAPAPAK